MVASLYMYVVIYPPSPPPFGSPPYRTLSHAGRALWQAWVEHKGQVTCYRSRAYVACVSQTSLVHAHLWHRLAINVVLPQPG